jgi:uncharacterized protein (DUF342 family)
MADSDSNTPATKGDLIALEERIKKATKADLIALEERLNSDTTAREERLNQKMDELTETFRDMQTEMLKAFYAFAETNQARLTETERATAALQERMSMMESRLIQLEKRLNMPPGA